MAAIAFYFPMVIGVKLGIVPLPTVETDPHIHGVVSLISYVIFLMVLVFGHKLSLPCFSEREEPKLFLDKCCINQTDEAKKLAGIKGIAAFLHNSERMIVLFSKDYFSRLWCSYEIAVFLHLKGTKQVDLMSLETCKLTLTISLCIFLVHCFLSLFWFSARAGLIPIDFIYVFTYVFLTPS